MRCGRRSPSRSGGQTGTPYNPSMWPKALSQLVELAPHVTRLLPLADRYLKDKTRGDDDTRGALDAHRASIESRLDAQRAGIGADLLSLRAAVNGLSDRLHADLEALGTVQGTQAATVQRGITDLEKHLSSTRADALAAKQATESFDGRLSRIEAAQQRAQTMAIAGLALLLALLVLIATLFLRAR